MEVHRHSNVVAARQIEDSQKNAEIQQKKKQHEENKVAKKSESYFAAAEGSAGKFSSFVLKNTNLHQANKSSFHPGVLNALYLNSKHLEALCKFFKNPKMNPKVIEGFAKKLYGSSSKDRAKLINNFIEEQGYSAAETYVVLSFLFDQGSNSGGDGHGGGDHSHWSQADTEETQELLQNLITKIEKQNSAYLFEVFNLSKHPDVQNNPKLAMGIANLQNNDSVDHSSLSGVLKFIQDTLDGDFNRLVSKVMRLRAEMLVMLTSATLTLEQRTQLANYGQIEQNLIILNTVQKSVDRFGKEIEGSKLYGDQTN